jgi:glycosyltransferase involved in cell wall biosynthesis
VTVYCQGTKAGELAEDFVGDVRTVEIGVRGAGALSTMVFDWRSLKHALSEKPDVALTLGYNTALFNGLLRWGAIPNLINMDGLEWQRGKWSLPAKAWLYLNERTGILLADHLVADHPEIANHLARHSPRDRITMIPYGSDRVNNADRRRLLRFGLAPEGYALVVARLEPENSLLEIVRAFSHRSRGLKLVVLGAFTPKQNRYHEVIRGAASEDVLFLGAIYEPETVRALRLFCRLYVHGHTVGGTNPSLVEALGAGSAVLAQDNRFNRWVAAPGAHYFRDETECCQQLDRLLNDPAELARMREGSRRRHAERFSWERVLAEYENLVESLATAHSAAERRP